ncbi:MAG: sulfotransferase domain-containing protein [Rhizomicrobium sp.]
MIYLVRDPRDVAVSLSHHNNTDIDDTIAMMNDPGGAFSRRSKGLAQQLRQKLLGWSGHAASWMEQGDTPVHVVRYEDLRADPVTHFSAALAFAERPAADADIARAVRHADFSELQRQESEKGFAERRSRNVPFFRSGRVGGWQNVLNAEQAARIEDAHAPMMYRLGYPMPGGRSQCKPVGV